MPKSHPPYAPEFRQRIVELVHKGRTPEELARQFEPSAQAIRNWVKQAEGLGAGEIVLNVMNADGTKDGYDLEMTAAVSEAVKIPVVASGGAGSPQHILDVLTTGKADAALAASIFHFNEHSVPKVKQFLHAHGVPVRLT